MHLFLSCICSEADQRFEPEAIMYLSIYMVDAVHAHCVSPCIDMHVCMAHWRICVHGAFKGTYIVTSCAQLVLLKQI